MGSIQGSTMIFGVPGNRGTFLFPRRAHLLTTCKAGGGIPPVGRARALSDGEFRSLRRATGNSANLIPCTKNAAAGRSTAAAFFVMTQHCR